MTEMIVHLEDEEIVELPERVVPVLFNLNISPVISPSIVVAGNGNLALGGAISVLTFDTVNNVLVNQGIGVGF